MIVHSPRHRDLARRARRRRARRGGRGLARADARPRRGRRLRAADRQRGRRRRRLARAQPRPALRARLRARRRSPASASASPPTASGRMGGDLLADIASEEVRRSERLVAIDDDAMLICPWASRSPFELRIIPRGPAPGFEEDGDVGRGDARAPRCDALAERFGTVPAAQPLGPDRAPRRRPLPLAHRHRAAARASRPASSSPPASTSTSTRRSAPRPSCATRSARLPPR